MIVLMFIMYICVKCRISLKTKKTFTLKHRQGLHNLVRYSRIPYHRIGFPTARYDSATISFIVLGDLIMPWVQTCVHKNIKVDKHIALKWCYVPHWWATGTEDYASVCSLSRAEVCGTVFPSQLSKIVFRISNSVGNSFVPLTCLFSIATVVKAHGVLDPSAVPNLLIVYTCQCLHWQQ